MKELKHLKILTICILLIILSYGKSIGQILVADTTILGVDFTKIKFNPNNNQGLDVNFSNQKKLLELCFWNDRALSKILIPINDLFAEQLNFSSSGLLSSRWQMKLVNGKYIAHGQSSFYDESGAPSHFYTYKEGITEGVFISYHKNGMVECMGRYKNGNQFGVWSYYNVNGVLLKKKKWSK